MTHQLTSAAASLVIAVLLTTSPASAEQPSPQPGWSLDMQPRVRGVELSGPFLINAFPLQGQGLESATIRVVRSAEVAELVADGLELIDAIGSATPVEGTLEMWDEDQLLAWSPAEPLAPSTNYTVGLHLAALNTSFSNFDVIDSIGFTTLADGHVGMLPTLSHVELELEERFDGCQTIVASFRLRDGDIPSPYLRLSTNAFPTHETTVAGVGRPLVFSQTFSTPQDTYCVGLETHHLTNGDEAHLRFCTDHDAALDDSGPFCTADYVASDDRSADGCRSGSGPVPISLAVTALLWLAITVTRRRTA